MTIPQPAASRSRARSRAARRLIFRLVLVAVVVAVVVGFGSPLWVRHLAGNAASAAARAGADTYAASRDISRAHDAATAAAERHHAHLDGFALVQGGVKVTVTRHAPTVLLDHIFTSWYDVRATASAAPH